MVLQYVCYGITPDFKGNPDTSNSEDASYDIVLCCQTRLPPTPSASIQSIP
jgi:hypothetical protein